VSERSSSRSATHVCVRVNNGYTADLRVRREATSLAEAGFRVTVLADEAPGLPAEEQMDGVLVRRLPKSPSRIPFWGLIKPLRDEHADIYHAHDVDSLFPVTAAARLAGKRPGTGRRAPVVYDSHELWSAHAADKLHARRRVLIALEGPLVRRAAGLISVSEEITSIIAEKYGYRGPALTLRNVPRVYTEAELAPHWAARDADPLTTISYVSIFQYGRGVIPLIRSLEFLPPDVCVNLLGPFPQADYEALAREAAAPLGDRVRFAGRIPTDEVVPRLAASKLSAVLIEPISESYRLSAPNKLFDSMAAGTPVIASDLPTIANVTRSSGAGVLCDVANPRDIARAVTEALPHLAEMRLKAREAAATYNWDAEQAALVGLYDRILEDHVVRRTS